MSGVGDSFGGPYREALARYVETHGEEALSASYELGRAAVRDGLSVLEFASIHHAALADMPHGAVRPGGEFFVEALSAYEMVQRVLQDARETARAERHQALVLRRLSAFLADASLALDAAGSLAEMLQLVAEHAREVVGARRCLVRVDGAMTTDGPVTAESGGEAGPDLTALFDALEVSTGPVRLTEAELAHHPARLALEPDGAAPRGGWLAAPLTALDGRAMGLVQLFGKLEGEFSELDAALLVQLAQMASAALERAWLYAR